LSHTVDKQKERRKKKKHIFAFRRLAAEPYPCGPFFWRTYFVLILWIDCVWTMW